MSQYKISLHYPHLSFLLRVFESAGVVVIFSDFMKSVPLMPVVMLLTTMKTI